MKTHFQILQLPQAYHLDRADLERRYLALSKEMHPDRFARAGAQERLLAVRSTTDLNDAYRVLKDDVKRAEYLLKLEGIDVRDENATTATKAGTDKVTLSPAFLMEIMELREALMEAQAEGSDAKVAALTEDVRARRAASLKSVDDGFRKYDAGDRAVLPELARTLMGVRYLDRFLEAVEKEEE